MSPHPAITAAPVLPRQLGPNDPYGISSMLASLSALYPDLYSDYSYSSYSLDAYYSSLMSEYSSLMAMPTLTGVPTIPTATAAGTGFTATTGAPTRTGGSVTGTAAGASASSIPNNNSNNSNDNSKGGMSTGAKIGIGVGVALGLALLAGIGILIWCMGKRKGKKNSTTIVAPGSQAGFAAQQPPPQTPQQFQQPPQMGYVHNQGYMQGVPQQGYPQQTTSPPPQYAQQQAAAGQPGVAGAYPSYAKGPDPNVAELEHEYHFAKPGVVEIGDGTPGQGTERRS